VIPRSSVRIPRKRLFGQIGIDTETRYYYVASQRLSLPLVFVRNLPGPHGPRAGERP